MSSPDFNSGVKIIAGTVATAGLLNYIYPYWLSDIQKTRKTKRIFSEVEEYVKRKHFVVDMLIEQATKQPYKAFIIYNNTIYTYGDIDRMSNKFANFVRRQGLKLGDTVAMFMYNEPAYLWMFFGFAKLGISCSFINYNLRGDSITHCLDVCGAKLLVVGHENELLSAVQNVAEHLAERQIDVWTYHGNARGFFKDIQDELERSSDDPIQKEFRDELLPTDISMFIFTSGTTGHPKAAKISCSRHVYSTLSLSSLEIRPDDRLYISLPLYHSSGMMMGVSPALKHGLTVILAKKFSVHNCWDDCRRHKATILLYIGEVCRYLLSLPETPEDKNHSIRIAIGNGLRQDIWTKFRRRYSIPTIAEFYGCTEGGFFTMNSDNTPAVVGKFHPSFQRSLGFQLVKYDFETALPLRDKNGWCIPVGIGEPGLLLSPVRGHYDGYSEKKLTEKRLIRNAFKDGDLYSNMGDLMVLNKDYYLYFVDRIGDTFRWKGENVSTTEVADIIGSHPAIQEANVYGIQIPGQDGRAGMAALVLKKGETFEPTEFYKHVTTSLPMYACPRFLRLMDKLDKTGTYKYKKGDLVKQGFNPKEIKNKMYYIDIAGGTYKPLHESAYLHIVTGKAKL
ncbi:long-chain fatty acid transport protein 6-like [Ptychodera flava]|uniref:long-chain fatty acid transport protein 6-like n=1 Tax=Ptychodera flava TaxID=63121 RepID=UPI00396A7AB2